MADNNWDSSSLDNDTTENPTDEFDSSQIDPNASQSDDSAAQGDDSTPDLQVLQTELLVTKQKLEELTRIAQQALADLSNYKKRTEEEKKHFVEFANTNLVNALLPILDNMHLSLEHAPSDQSNQAWMAGIKTIFKQLEDTLTQFGVIKIDHHQKDFDPNVHEAISIMAGPKDKILKAFQHGYKMGEKVLRRSKVIVGNGEGNEEEKTSESQEIS